MNEANPLSGQEVPQEDLPEQSNSLSGQEVPEEDLPEQRSLSGQEVPPEDLPNQEENSPLRQLGTTAEGFAQGYAGPVATGIEKGLNYAGVPGFSDQDIAARKNTNPIEFGAGETAGLGVGLMTGTGEAGLIGKALWKAPEEAGALARVGSAALKGMIENGIIQGTDEISKAMLNQGDPSPAVASHIAEAGAIGLVGGGLFSGIGMGASKGLQALEDNKVGSRIVSYLSGIAHGAQSAIPMIGEPVSEAAAMSNIPNIENFHNPSFEAGKKSYDVMTNGVISKVKYAADIAAYKSGTMADLALAHVGGVIAEKILRKVVPKVSQKVVGPALVKILSSNTVQGIPEALDYATSMSKGAANINSAIEGLFKYGGNSVLNYVNSDRDREKLREKIENADLAKEMQEESLKESQEPKGFAKGGFVKPSNGSGNIVAKHWPAQNIMLNAAKGRVTGYLNSIRPVKNPMKLPFDKEIKDPQKEKDYNETLDLANKPLSILNKVKDGTLLPKHMHALNSLYPELYSHLSSKMTAELMKHQLEDRERPAYKTRQAMSLFLGSNLESSLVPANIQAAQAVFQNQNQQRQAQSQKTSKANLKLGENMMTPDQSRAQRLNKN
jgi:hypothetical protein